MAIDSSVGVGVGPGITSEFVSTVNTSGFGSTGQMSVTSGSAFIPKNWARDVEIQFESNKVMAGLVHRRDYDVLTEGGSIQVPYVTNLGSFAVATNGQANFQSPSEQYATITINRYFESSIFIEDQLSIQSKYDIRQLYTPKIAEALERTIEQDLTGLYSSATQTVSTGSTPITEANIVRAEQYLNDANVPPQDRHLVIAPATMNQIVQIPRFTEYQTTGEKDAVMVGGNMGLIGKVYSFDVHMTTQVFTVVGTPTTVHNLAFQKDAITLAMQKGISMKEEPRPSYFGTAYVATALWGFALIRSEALVDVRCQINS